MRNLRIALLWTGILLALHAQAQPAATTNVYQQLAPFRAYYSTQAQWPRAHGWKPYKRYEWDMLQRGFPTGEIPAGAYWEALEQRGRMRQHTLDEPWVNLGPYNHGGRARVLRFHPDDPNIMFVGAVAGGLWKSTDAGQNWLPFTDALPNLAVGCFEIDPSNPDIMYLGTGEGYYNGDAVLGIGLLKTTNGGQSWATTGLSYQYHQGESILQLDIDPRNSNIVLASTNAGLYRSATGGTNFTLVRTGDIKALVRDPQNPDVLLCAAGSAWGDGQNGVYRSTNNGVTWTRSSTGLPAADQLGRIVLAIYPGNSQIVFAGISGNFGHNGAQMLGVYRSVDNGVNWEQMSQQGENHYASQGWYNMALAVKPDDAAVLLSSGLDTYRSTNSGLLWTRKSWWHYEFGSPDYVHADHHEIVFHPTNFNEVWEVTDGGIFRSTDLGDNWVEMNNGFVTFQYYAMGNATLDTALAYGGTQDNGSFRYSGSPDFSSVFGGDGGYCVVDPTDNNTVYVEWQMGHRYRSDNGGANFDDINPGIEGDGPWVTPMLLDPFDHLTIYTTTENGRVWRSPNQGRNSSWQMVGNVVGGSMQVLAASPVQQGRLYLGTSSEVYRFDGTGNWTNVTWNLPGAWVTRVTPDPFDADVVYVTLSGFGHGHVWKSTTGGGSWQNISGNLPNVPFQDVLVDPNEPNRLYAGGDIGVFFSENGGQDWQILGEGLPAVRVDDMDLQPVTGMLRAATHGRGMWETRTGSAPLAMLYPNGGETLAPGQTIEILWSGISFGGEVRIELNRAYPGPTWETLEAATPNDGRAEWTVSGAEAEHARFRITHLGEAVMDTSNGDTRIVNPRLAFGWPMAGDTVLSGVRDTVHFARLLVPEGLRLELNRDYPDGAWQQLATNIGADSTAIWIVRLPAAEHARLRLTSLDRPEITVMTGGDFVIRPPAMALDAPQGGEEIAAGLPYEIRWTASEHHGAVGLLVNRSYPEGPWETISTSTTNDGSYAWTVPSPAAEHCRLRLATVFDPFTFVESAADFAITAAAAEEPALPASFVLHRPYPNPFNPTTRVDLELPARMHVEARVFNRLGQAVAVLADDDLEPGFHRLSFDGAGLPSGVYFIRVHAGSETQILKAALVK